MKEQEIKGAARRAAGAVQDAVGGATGNASLKAKGKINKAAGTVQQNIGKTARKLDDE